jgi:hypothetical protein
MAGQSCQENHRRKDKEASHNKRATKGQPTQDSHDRTVTTGQPSRDSHYKKQRDLELKFSFKHCLTLYKL